MTVSELIYKVKEPLKLHSGDNVISDRTVWKHIMSSFLLLLKRDKRKIYNTNVFKRIEVKPEQVNLSCCIPLDCMGVRFKVPGYLEDDFGIIYKGLTTVDYSKSFRVVSPRQYTIKNNIKGNTQSYAFHQGEYIYLSEDFNCLVFEYLADPSDSCKVLEEESPIPNYLEDPVCRMAMEKLSMTLRIPFDHTQNKNSSQ